MIEKKARTEFLQKDLNMMEFPTGITKDPLTDRLRVCQINTPTLEELELINKKHQLGIREHELEKYQDVIGKLAINYDRLMALPEPVLEVKYPRVPGIIKRRHDEDNKHNAWFVKTEIKGQHDGKLKNKNVVVCDTLPIAGVPACKGSRLMMGAMPNIDCTVVTKALDEGAIIKGKSMCEAWGVTGNSFNSLHGPVLNVKDGNRSAGGASSGAAVLVGLKEVDIAMGIDGAGHVRVPASWNGIVGMKPTWGLVPCTGTPAFDPLLTHVGTMADKVQDIALTLEAIAIKDKDQWGYDLDLRQPHDLQTPKLTDKLTGDVRGLKVGIITEGFLGCERDVDAMVRNAAKMLTKAGATCVEEVSIPAHLEAESIFFPLLIEGGYILMNNFGDNTMPRGYHNTWFKEVFGNAYKSRMHTSGPVGKLITLMGTMMHDKYNMLFYSKAQNLTRVFKRAYDEAFSKYDILITPTTKFKAPLLPHSDHLDLKDIIHQSMNMFTNTVPFNLTGHPALTINCGMSENLPIGMQIIGKEFDDATVLKTAFAFEKVRGF